MNWAITWRARGFFQRLRGTCDHLEFRPELGVGLHVQCGHRPALTVVGLLGGVPRVHRASCTEHLHATVISVGFALDAILEES